MTLITKYLRLIPTKFKVFYLILGLLYSSVFVIQYYLPIIQKNLIDTAVTDGNIFNKYFNIILIAYGSYYVFSYLFNLLQQMFSLRLQKVLSLSFFENIVSMTKSKILSRGTGYYYDCLVSDISRSLGVFSMSLFGFLFSSIQTVFIFIIIYQWSRVISLVFLVSFCLSVIISILTAKYEKMLWEDIRKTSSALSGFVIDAFGNNNIIKHFQAMPRFKSFFGQNYAKTQKIEIKSTLLTVSSDNIQSAISTIASLIVIIYSLNLLIKDEMTYGGMIATIAYFQMLFNPIQNFYKVLSIYYRSEVAIKRVLNIYSSSSKQSELSTIQRGFDNIEIKSVVFKNITLKLKNNEILSNVGFETMQEKSIGIVGLSGEGKTSMLKMLLKDLEPTSGEILINNRNLKEISSSLYFSRINILSQEIEIFNKDLIFNLTLGKNLVSLNEKDQIKLNIENTIRNIITEMMNTCSKSNSIKIKAKSICGLIFEQEHIESFKMLSIFVEPMDFDRIDIDLYYSNITKLLEQPDCLAIRLTDMIFKQNYIIKEKFDQIVSKLNLGKLSDREFGENGTFISGGEKQKIVLARFLLNDDYDFYILDEPFTNMDALTEKEMLSFLKKELSGKTGLIISHKFNILLDIADEFIVLKDGTIDQRGTHIDLLEKEGLYRELFNCFSDSKNNKT